MLQLYKNQQGVVSIEMGILLMFFSFMLVGIIDFGNVMGSTVQLSNALRIGEQVAARQPTNTNGITQSVKSATSLPSQNVSSTATTFCECNGTSATCGSTCSGTMASYVTVTAGYNVPLLLNYPGLSNPFPINKSVSVRVQ